MAWAPTCPSCAPCNRAGCTTRHVFRVASCPHYQFLRALNYQGSPVATRAISEELVQSVNGENIHMNGANLDHLPDVHPRRQRTDTTTVHAGERKGRPKISDSLTTPIVQTATFTFRHVPLLMGLCHCKETAPAAPPTRPRPAEPPASFKASIRGIRTCVQLRPS